MLVNISLRVLLRRICVPGRVQLTIQIRVHPRGALNLRRSSNSRLQCKYVPTAYAFSSLEAGDISVLTLYGHNLPFKSVRIQSRVINVSTKIERSLNFTCYPSRMLVIRGGGLLLLS